MLAKRIAISCLVLAVMVVMCACTDDGAGLNPSDRTSYREQKGVMAQQADLIKTQPTPRLTYSQERAQQSRKAELFANPEKLGYIYLISFGKVMAFYPVKGKISSLNTYLVPGDKLYQGEVMQGPDIDGTYGQNAKSIFFFTPQGAYIEWYGEYMYSDTPLQMNTPPEIVYVAPLK